MNKRQLVIAWIIGIVFCIIAINKAFISHPILFRGYPMGSTTTFNPVIGIGIPILIIGGLLVYTLRTKKKD